MRFVVYGAGAVGGVVGGLLAAAGEAVTLVARGALADAIERRGLIVDTPGGRTAFRIPVARGAGEIGLGVGDAVLLAVKSQDAPAALNDLITASPASPASPRHQIVACLQNGVANEPAALRLFPDVYGVCVMCRQPISSRASSPSIRIPCRASSTSAGTRPGSTREPASSHGPFAQQGSLLRNGRTSCGGSTPSCS